MLLLVCNVARILGGDQAILVADFNEVDKGGHFAAWEEPDLFAAELRAAFKSLR